MEASPLPNSPGEYGANSQFRRKKEAEPALVKSLQRTEGTIGLEMFAAGAAKMALGEKLRGK